MNGTPYGWMLGSIAAALVTAVGAAMLSGAAGASLAAGFLAPLEAPALLVLVVLLGVWGAVVARGASWLMPLSCLTLLVIAFLLALDASVLPPRGTFVLGGVLLFAMTVSLVYSRVVLASLMVAGSLAFQLGSHMSDALPLVHAPLFYLLGVVVSASLLMAIGVAFGIATRTHWLMGAGKLKRLPAVSSFLSLF